MISMQLLAPLLCLGVTMASVANEILINEDLTASANGDSVTLDLRSKAFIGTIDASSVNAATTVAGKIQHSPDKTNWTDAISFTDIVGSDSNEVKQITVNLLPYVRAVVTLTGATQIASVKILLWFDQEK